MKVIKELLKKKREKYNNEIILSVPINEISIRAKDYLRHIKDLEKTIERIIEVVEKLEIKQLVINEVDETKYQAKVELKKELKQKQLQELGK